MRHYRLLRILGTGGMGTVYEAVGEIAHGATHPVAIKIAHARYRDPESQERFLREIDTAMRLNHQHPNLVTVHGGGETRDGDLYLVMERVHGASTSQLCELGPLSPAIVQRIAYDIFQALAFLHHHKVIHRDVSASNILIDRKGRVLLTDFGLIKPLGGSHSDRFRGNPAYASPEQLRIQPLTSATDLFSLGAVLYRLYTGKRPFDEDHPWEMVQAMRSGPDSLPDLSAPDLETLIADLMNFDPTRRPTAEQALEHLDSTDEPRASDADLSALVNERAPGTTRPSNENQGSSETEAMIMLPGLDMGDVLAPPSSASLRPGRPRWTIVLPTIAAAVALVIASLSLWHGYRGEQPEQSTRAIERDAEQDVEHVTEPPAIRATASGLPENTPPGHEEPGTLLNSTALSATPTSTPPADARIEPEPATPRQRPPITLEFEAQKPTRRTTTTAHPRPTPEQTPATEEPSGPEDPSQKRSRVRRVNSFADIYRE